MSASLVGSEMCIRDRPKSSSSNRRRPAGVAAPELPPDTAPRPAIGAPGVCLLYTSDAADDM
eukprot:2366141-Alexandrium_andersonii.AAC.1